MRKSKKPITQPKGIHWSLPDAISGERCFVEPAIPPSEIAAWTEQRAEEERQAFFHNDAPPRGNIFAHAHQNEESAACIGIKANDLVGMLFELAKRGSRESVKRICELAADLCSQVHQLAESQPELVRDKARYCGSWPVMKSLHPFLDTDHRVFLAGISLGESAPVVIDKMARWKLDPASQIAIDILCYLTYIRDRNTYDVDYGRLNRILASLPQFSEASADRWWKVAKSVLIASYPAPERIPVLSALVTADSKRRSPGRMKQAIFEVLRSRFLSLAKPSPV